MAISISSKGSTLKDDLNAGKIRDSSYLTGFNDKQRTGLINAIMACIHALDVDGNKLHNTSLTIAASLTSSSITVQIS